MQETANKKKSLFGGLKIATSGDTDSGKSLKKRVPGNRKSQGLTH